HDGHRRRRRVRDREPAAPRAVPDPARAHGRAVLLHALARLVPRPDPRVFGDRALHHAAPLRGGADPVRAGALARADLRGAEGREGSRDLYLQGGKGLGHGAGREGRVRPVHLRPPHLLQVRARRVRPAADLRLGRDGLRLHGRAVRAGPRGDGPRRPRRLPLAHVGGGRGPEGGRRGAEEGAGRSPAVIGRNVSALVAAQVATKAINLLVSVALVRWLGVHELGRYAYVLAFCFPFGALADFGLATLAIRDASRAPAQTPRVIAVVRRAALTLAVASSAAMVGLALLLGHDAAIVAAIGIGGLASVVSARTMPSLVLLTARERMGRLSLHRVTGSVLSSAITVGVLAAGGGVGALLAGSLAAGTLMWLVARALAGSAGPAPAVPAGAGVALLRRAVPFGLLMAGFAL